MKSKILFLLLCVPLFCFAEELKPYAGEPPKITLSAEQKEKLEKFEPVYLSVTDKGGAGGGQAVFRVKASPKIVWDVISDFPNYPKFNSDVKKTEYYKPIKDDFVFVKFVAGPLNTTYYIKHYYPGLKKGWGTWELDKAEKIGSIKECIGFWRVDEVPGNPNMSDVSYSVNLEVAWYLTIIRKMLVNEGIKKATHWVKIEAEKRAKQ